MNEREREKVTILAHSHGPFVGPDGRLIDPLDDSQLDRLLEEALEDDDEPRLLLVDRLLNKLRIRREV